MSQHALMRVCKDIAENDLPTAFSRRSQHRARKSMTEGMIVGLEIEVTLRKKQTTVKVGFLNPFAYLQHIAEHSDAFARVLLQTFQAYPCSFDHPWHIILYQDGVDPGDGLKKEKSRHCAIFYWSFLEFGPDTLSHEEMWACGAIVRTHIAKTLAHGLSELTYKLLEMFHGKTRDMRIHGLLVNIRGHTFRIFAKPRFLLADIPALAEMISSKGQGGLKNCALCMNNTNFKPPRGAVPMHEFSSYCTPSCEVDFTKFIKHTNKSLREQFARMDEVRRTRPGDLEHMETNVWGFTWTPYQILAEPRFDILGADDEIVSVIAYDWCHTYCQGGCGDAEFGNFMRLMHRATTQDKIQHECTYEKIGEYLLRWTLPKSYNGELDKLFDSDHAHRNISNSTFSSSSSQFLALTPILRRYLIRVVRPQLQDTPLAKYVDSMVAVLDVILLCQRARRKGAVDPDELERAISHHLRLFVAAWTEYEMKPKHHYCHHLVLFLRLFGFLLACFVHERKHRAVIRYAKPVHNLKSFEMGVLEEVICHNLWELGSSFHRHAFTTAKPSKAQLLVIQDEFKDFPTATFTLHHQLYRNGYVCSDDVVAFEDAGAICIGQLHFTIGVSTASDVELVSFVTLYERGAEADGCIDCTIPDDSQMLRILSSQLRVALTYSMSLDGRSCVVIAPPYV